MAISRLCTSERCPNTRCAATRRTSAGNTPTVERCDEHGRKARRSQGRGGEDRAGASSSSSAHRLRPAALAVRSARVQASAATMTRISTAGKIQASRTGASSRRRGTASRSPPHDDWAGGKAGRSSPARERRCPGLACCEFDIAFSVRNAVRPASHHLRQLRILGEVGAKVGCSASPLLPSDRSPSAVAFDIAVEFRASPRLDQRALQRGVGGGHAGLEGGRHDVDAVARHEGADGGGHEGRHRLGQRRRLGPARAAASWRRRRARVVFSSGGSGGQSRRRWSRPRRRRAPRSRPVRRPDSRRGAPRGQACGRASGRRPPARCPGSPKRRGAAAALGALDEITEAREVRGASAPGRCADPAGRPSPPGKSPQGGRAAGRTPCSSRDRARWSRGW